MSTPRFLRKARRPLEQGLVLIARWLIPLLPRFMILGLSRVLGKATYRFSGRLRKVGMANLELALGDTSEAERTRILKQSFQSFALTILDIFWFSRGAGRRMQRWIHFDETLEQVKALQPLVCVTGHMGNWEQLGQALTLNGVPLCSVAAPLKNNTVDLLFQTLREQTGQEIVPRQGAMKRLIQVLKNGGNTAVLLDQNTYPSEGGVFVDFFGLPTPVAQAPAALALRTKAHIVMGFCLHRGDGHYDVGATEVFDPSKLEHENPKEIPLICTRLITRYMEDAIRKHPESWLWSYKRWKLIPPDADRTRYPYYAHAMSESEQDRSRRNPG